MAGKAKPQKFRDHFSRFQRQRPDTRRSAALSALTGPQSIWSSNSRDMRMSNDPVDGFLNRCKKPSAEAGLLRFVVSGGLDHLGLCARMELDRFHANAANASANTFSA